MNQSWDCHYLWSKSQIQVFRQNFNPKRNYNCTKIFYHFRQWFGTLVEDKKLSKVRSGQYLDGRDRKSQGSKLECKKKNLRTKFWHHAFILLLKSNIDIIGIKPYLRDLMLNATSRWFFLKKILPHFFFNCCLPFWTIRN